MEKPTACIDAETQKKIDALETEAQQHRSELSELREQATAAAHEKKAARPDYSKMKCAISGRMGHIRTDRRKAENTARRPSMLLLLRDFSL